ncbi:C-C motif chemokine 13-like [Balaenoptera acutorostrata]|uniref:C-C motif chemokine 13-like n=1 Tax=Balaenoptera acutorostrata TaxID=9767 RepID=A0ABM3SQS9_BALAC|nr:C-C motif chemokine 13-like [Balaenoptera acutorostrata]
MVTTLGPEGARTEKVSTAPLCLLPTAAAISTQVLAQPNALRDRFTCCFPFNHKKIPLQRLKSYGSTSSQCLFRTKLTKDIGANPKEKWVWNYMKHLGQKPHTPKTWTLSATLRPSQRLRNDYSPPAFLSLSWTKLT